MTSETLEKHRQAAREEWQDPERAAAWSRWHAKFAIQTRAATEAIVRECGAAAGDRVLDLASGSGQPALELARTVGPRGLVIATDLSHAMLLPVLEKARQAGLRNIAAQQAHAEELPLPGETFDAVTCRFGIMFAPDVVRALREMRRVLKPGKRAAFIAWGPRELNPTYTTSTAIIGKYVEIPLPAPGTPEGHRFAEAGSLSSELRAAGFDGVREELITVPWVWPGTVDEMWECQKDLRGAPMQRNLDRIGPERLPQVLAEIKAAMQRYSDGKQVNMTAALVLASGRRP